MPYYSSCFSFSVHSLLWKSARAAKEQLFCYPEVSEKAMRLQEVFFYYCRRDYLCGHAE